jgi:hypothetical protein
MTAKYSPRMREELLDLVADMRRGMSDYRSTPTGTSVALLARGALVHLTRSKKGLTRAGAEAVGVDYDELVDAVHAYALEMNESFRRCPLADEGCEFVTFGHPATPFGNHREITSDDQITYHINQGHMTLTEANFIPNIAKLTDEHRAQVAEFIEAYRKAKAHDARTGVGTGTSEARCRRALRDHTLVYVEGSEGRIDDVAVLGGVKFHVTGVSLDGWYYPNQITVYDAKIGYWPWAGPDTRIVDVEEAREAALREYMERHPGGPIEIMGRLEPEAVATPDYAVSLYMDAEHCSVYTAHDSHGWSWLGPEVSHFCDGTAVEATIPVPDDKPLCAGHPSEAEAILCDGRCAVADEEEPTTWAQYHENHPEVTASWGEQNGRPVTCPCPKCDPHGRQPKADIIVDEIPSLFPGAAPVRTYADGSQSVGPYPPLPRWNGPELPELHGPMADDHGDAVAAEASAHLRYALGDGWPGRYVRLEYVADGNLGFITEGITA